ncbi:hypothetical protein DYBT9275_02038 [Dyadobacter sp. CECT 9275]|uniref:SGNH hydrolase-type esterase domain-containing protein n=1 Tax=Dyadobacter helix TaxID=2822344 RepID=A0A916JBU6_9BACT|nr:hypothetical protein [Dyadobacter sp. CECT 9275]CAG4998617.1 hypothetical protein DYBT9275_02038 [Dyadobacter sp. CECT 9275]
MLKITIRFLFFILIIAGITEVVLRVKFGFCNSPLYVSDPDFEYIYAPNQEVERFGNVVRTNSLSMRNPELTDSDTVNVLLTGDSVVNGGSLTDQDSTASAMLEIKLKKSFDKRIRVLNISAGSWGPDNVAGYLKKHGVFNAKLICLVTSSHDAHDIMSHQSPVGLDPGFPSKQYSLALIELWDRYRYLLLFHLQALFFAPQDKEPEQSEKGTLKKDAVKEAKLNEAGIRKPGIGFNPGYAQIDSIARANNIPFFIYLHPEISEIEMGHFNDQGQEIIDFAQQHNVRLINEFDLGITKHYYRDMDVVHFNNQGQKFLAANLYPLFLEYLKNTN